MRFNWLIDKLDKKFIWLSSNDDSLSFMWSTDLFIW